MTIDGAISRSTAPATRTRALDLLALGVEALVVAAIVVNIAVTFGNDTGAYFAGRAFGRHKLYPTISPAKTVEGAVGGLVAGVGVLLAGHATVASTLTVADCFLVAGPAAVLGPIGDLVESMIKRSLIPPSPPKPPATDETSRRRKPLRMSRSQV